MFHGYKVIYIVQGGHGSKPVRGGGRGAGFEMASVTRGWGGN